MTTKTFFDSTRRWQRLCFAALLFGSAVLILPNAVEPFMLPKMTLVSALTIGIAGLSVVRAIWTRQVHWPRGAVTWMVLALAVGVLVSAGSSPTPLASFIGFYGRYTGALPYLAYLILFVILVRIIDRQFIRLLTRSALAALAFVVSYGMLQAADLDPVPYRDIGLSGTFSSLGNVNFAGAWVSIVSALALVAVLDVDEDRRWRLFAAILLPVSSAFTVLTGTFQGPLVLLVVALWILTVMASEPGNRVRDAAERHPRVALSVAGGVVFAAAAALAVFASFLRRQLDKSLSERLEFYSAAFGIFRDQPVLGTGLDTYAHHFLAYRPASHAAVNTLAGADAPHSVPIGMFSNGGVVLGVLYLATVLFVGFLLVRGAFRSRGWTRKVLAGWGAVWVGYQAQSLVSIDVPPLALLHWISAGVIIAVAAPPAVRTFRLPGPAVSRAVRRKGKSVGPLSVPASTRLLLGVAAVAALLGLWFVALPLRADLVAASAAPLAKAGQLNGAVERLADATELNPAEPSYPFLLARAHAAAGRPDEALTAAAEAARRDTGTVEYALLAAQQALRLNDSALAARWYGEAVRRDPLDPPVLTETARHLLTVGDATQAERLLERSVSVQPSPAALVLLASTREALDDAAGARAALELALTLDPTNEAAKQALGALG